MAREELVEKARAGDDNAFYELIQLRRELLYRTAYSYVKNREDALDIVGDTVYKAYTSIRKLKEPAFFNTWLTRILINCSLDQLKKKSREVSLDKLEAPAATLNSAENIDLHRAVDSLDSKYRTVVILKYFHDLTITQIAEIMECPQGTIKTYLHRALQAMRAELKEEWLNA